MTSPCLEWEWLINFESMDSPDKNIISLLRNSLDIELKENISLNELREILATHINPLISNNFNKLISILYRLDINETTLKQLLAEKNDTDAAMIIADLIIQRQLQKIKSRESFRKNDSAIDEDEKW